MSKTFQVSGMTCGGCQRSVERVVEKLPGVTHVEVDLSSGRVVVHGEPESAAVVEAIQRAGFGAEAA